jgi:hypothetical protein
MKLNEFEWVMGEMMKDRDYLYGSLTKDLYFLDIFTFKDFRSAKNNSTVNVFLD